MATLSECLYNLKVWLKPHPDARETDRAPEHDSDRVQRFVRDAYQKTNGATAELKSVYHSYLQNERRRVDKRKRTLARAAEQQER